MRIHELVTHCTYVHVYCHYSLVTTGFYVHLITFRYAESIPFVSSNLLVGFVSIFLPHILHYISIHHIEIIRLFPTHLRFSHKHGRCQTSNISLSFYFSLNSQTFILNTCSCFDATYKKAYDFITKLSLMVLYTNESP